MRVALLFWHYCCGAVVVALSLWRCYCGAVVAALLLRRSFARTRCINLHRCELITAARIGHHLPSIPPMRRNGSMIDTPSARECDVRVVHATDERRRRSARGGEGRDGVVLRHNNNA